MAYPNPNRKLRHQFNRKTLRRIFFRVKHRKKEFPFNLPNCDWCKIPNDPIEGCNLFKTEIDEKDWKRGLYPECCIYY